MNEISNKRIWSYSKFNFKDINSLMIAFLITSHFIAIIFASMSGIENGFLPMVIILIIFLTCFSFFYLKNKRFIINKINLLLMGLVLTYFIFSFWHIGIKSYTGEYFFNFAAFGIVAYILVVLPFSSQKIIVNVMLIGNMVLLTPFGFMDFISLDTSITRINMGATYAILPIVVATLIYIFLIKDNMHIIIKIITYISNGFLFIILFTQGSRGAVLAIFLLFAVIIHLNLLKWNKKLYFFILFPTTFFIILIFFNMEKFITFINMALQSVGIEFATLLKSLELINEHGLIGILNKRESIYIDAVNLIKDSPIFGHGIGSFAELYKGTYPHNIFLHLMVEGGVILTLPFLVIILSCFWVLLKPWNGSDLSHGRKALLLFLFISCIPRLFLSNYLWRNQAFWLMTFIFILSNSNSRVISVKKLYDDFKQCIASRFTKSNS